MTRFELDTKVYTDFAAADANMECDFAIWQAAADVYWAEEAKAKAAWNAIPDGEAKDSAYENAEQMLLDSDFSAANRLAWYLAAIASYDTL